MNREEKAAWQRAWKAAHRAETAAYQAAWRASHRAEQKAYLAAWKASHLRNGADREYDRKHNAKRRGGQVCEHTSCLEVGAFRLVLMTSEHRCYLCGSPLVDGVDMQMDHVIPVARGGLYCAENLLPVCGPCNSRKGVKPI